MSFGREHEYEALTAALVATRLPDRVREPLRAALEALHTERPNAFDKLTAPLGRALRNPAFPDIWEKAVSDVPTSAVYAPVRDAALNIAAFVRGAA